MAGPIIGLGEVLWDLLPSGPRAGGAPFNFAFHCHQLGHPAVIVSRVGDDELGHSLRAEVRRLGMSDEFIQVDAEHPTGTVPVRVAADGQPTYAIAENVAWDFLEWRDDFLPLIRSARAVSFGTLAQRNVASRKTIQHFLASFSEGQIRLCDLNLRPPFVEQNVLDGALEMADWLKLNEDEAAEIRADGQKCDRFELKCITRGSRGCEITFRGERVAVPGLPVRVADTVGAGDAFTAGLLTQLIEGKALAEAARFANALAALVASQPGGTPVIDRAEVERTC